MGTSFVSLRISRKMSLNVQIVQIACPEYVEGFNRFAPFMSLLDRTWNRNVVKLRNVFPHELGPQRGGEVA